MDELFNELNLYLEPPVAANLINSAEQNTAALIASSMNSEYEDDWSTPASSYRDSHTPLTNSSVSSNSADQKLGLGENMANQRLIQNGPSISSIEAEEALFTDFNAESLPPLLFHDYAEMRNYTDLDLLEATAPTPLDDVDAISQPNPPNITPLNQEKFQNKNNCITPVKARQKKTPSKKKTRQVPNVSKQLKSGSTQCSQEVNAEGGFLGFSEESLRAGKFYDNEEVRNHTDFDLLEATAPTPLDDVDDISQPNQTNITLLNQEFKDNSIKPVEVRQKKICNPTTYEEPGNTFFTSQAVHDDCTTSEGDIWTAESPKNDGNILKKKFVKKSLPQNPPNPTNHGSTNQPVEKKKALNPRKEAPIPESKSKPKAPSYLTLFPMRCKEYPMIYSCNHCVGIFTSVRAGQLHDCVKKRRGRKAGSKLQQSYSRNVCDWAPV